ncbi:MAG: cadherin-like domain-containing protein [Nitrospirota bacterium]|nr:cadherin-like domain-containing protein [Nitrospirota bacterium]
MHLNAPTRRGTALVTALCTLLLTACGGSGGSTPPAGPPASSGDMRGVWSMGVEATNSIACGTGSNWSATLSGTGLDIPYQLGSQLSVTPALTLNLTDGVTTENWSLPATTVATTDATSVIAAVPVTSTALGALDVVLTLGPTTLTAELSGGACTGTLTHDLTPPDSFTNTAPVAIVPANMVTVGSAVSGNLLGFAFDDPDGAPLPAFDVVTPPTGPSTGNLSVNALTGEFTYTPPPIGTGADSFTVSFNDGSGPVTADVSVTNNGTGGAPGPNPVPDTRGDTTVTTPPTGGAIDCSGWSVLLALGSKVSVPYQWGTLINVTTDITIQLIETAGPGVTNHPLTATVPGILDPLTGTVTARFPITGSAVATDVDLVVSGTTLTLSLVNGVTPCTGSETYTVIPLAFTNAAPTARAGVSFATWGLPKPGNLLNLAFIDPDGGHNPVFSIVTAPIQGTLTFDSFSGDFVYTPPVAAIDDTFRVRFDDGTNFAEADVIVVNNGAGIPGGTTPVVSDFHYTVWIDPLIPTTHPLPASDPLGGQLTYVETAAPLYGTIAATPGGGYDPITNEFTYTPTGGTAAFLTDSFAFQVQDSQGTLSAIAVVSLRRSGPDSRGTYTLGTQSAPVSCLVGADTWSILLSGNLVVPYQFNTLATLANGTLPGGASTLVVDATSATQPAISQGVTAYDYTTAVSAAGGLTASNFAIFQTTLGNPVVGMTVSPPLSPPGNIFSVFFSCGGFADFSYTYTPWTNAAPVAVAAPAFNSSTPPLTLADFILDPDGGAGPYFEIRTPATAGVVAISDPTTGAFTYTPPLTPGTDSFTFFHHDGTDSVTVTVTVTNP